MLHGCGLVQATRNAKGKLVFNTEQGTNRNRTASFSVGYISSPKRRDTRKYSSLKTFRSPTKLRVSPAFDSLVVVFQWCLYLILFVSGKIATTIPNAFSPLRLLKEKLETSIFHLMPKILVVLRSEGKRLSVDTSWRPHFSSGD